MKRYTITRDPELLTDILYDRKYDIRFRLPAYENPLDYVSVRWTFYHVQMIARLWLYRLRHPNHV